MQFERVIPTQERRTRKRLISAMLAAGIVAPLGWFVTLLAFLPWTFTGDERFPVLFDLLGLSMVVFYPLPLLAGFTLGARYLWPRAVFRPPDPRLPKLALLLLATPPLFWTLWLFLWLLLPAQS